MNPQDYREHYGIEMEIPFEDNRRSMTIPSKMNDLFFSIGADGGGIEFRSNPYTYSDWVALKDEWDEFFRHLVSQGALLFYKEVGSPSINGGHTHVSKPLINKATQYKIATFLYRHLAFTFAISGRKRMSDLIRWAGIGYDQYLSACSSEYKGPFLSPRTYTFEFRMFGPVLSWVHCMRNIQAIETLIALVNTDLPQVPASFFKVAEDRNYEQLLMWWESNKLKLGSLRKDLFSKGNFGMKKLKDGSTRSVLINFSSEAINEEVQEIYRHERAGVWL